MAPFRYPDANLYVYIVVQTVHIIHTASFLWFALMGVYTVNVYYCVILLFFTKKFQFLTKRIKKLNFPESKAIDDRKVKSKGIDNRKLSRLIIEHNRVLFEVSEMNELFKVGFCTNCTGMAHVFHD